MGINSEIKCDLCDYIFKTVSIKEREFDYESRESYDVIRFYPSPEENAHLVRNYICDSCYNDITNVIKNKLILKGDEYLKSKQEKYEEAYLNYQKELSKIDEKFEDVEVMYNQILNLNNFNELNKQEIDKLIHYYPYTSGATYYLERVSDIENKNKGYKSFEDWAKTYHLYISKYPNGYSFSSLVSKETFVNEILNCTVKDKSVKELIEVISKITC